MKFSSVGRAHLSESVRRIRGDNSSAKFSLKYLRPSVRGLIFNVCAGERIPPEVVRVVLTGILKVASLRAVVCTIPSKEKGLRIQRSDIVLGEPGVGKGQAFQ